MSSHADTIRYAVTGHLTKVEDDAALAALDALLAENLQRQHETEQLGIRYELLVGKLEAENQRLRDALEEACDWLDADLAVDPKPSTYSADSELLARWREALAGDAE